LIAIMIVTIVIAVSAYHPIFNFLRNPYCELAPSKRAGGKSCDLVLLHPTDTFFVRLRVSLISGVLFSAPIWLYELWAFITPGLHRNERRWTLAFLVSATVLFASGAAMAYLFLRTALNLLLGFGGNGIKSLLTVTDYLSIVTHLLIVFGASFLFPLLIILLNLAGARFRKTARQVPADRDLPGVRVRRVRDPVRRSLHHAGARAHALPVLRGCGPGREMERPAARPP
jgi:sec-independent protein translocase protein TatC